MLAGHDTLIRRIQSIVKVYKVDCVPFNAKIRATVRALCPIACRPPRPGAPRVFLFHPWSSFRGAGIHVPDGALGFYEM